MALPGEPHFTRNDRPSQECSAVACSYSSVPVDVKLLVRNLNLLTYLCAFSAYVTAYIVVVLVAFGAAVSGTVWAVFIFVRR